MGGAGQLVGGAGQLVGGAGQLVGWAGQLMGGAGQVMGGTNQGPGRTRHGVGRAGMVGCWRQAGAGLGGGAGQFGMGRELGRAGVGLRRCGRRTVRDRRIVGGAVAVRLVHDAHTAHPGHLTGHAPLPASLPTGRGREPTWAQTSFYNSGSYFSKIT
jgi:X-X-X-Leu-X-X-Gly heptad repeat protein